MTERVSVASDGTQGNDGSSAPAISADGRYVVFSSGADNLVEGDTNGVGDVFVHDRRTGQTQLVSIASDGTQGNNGSIGSSISADGRYVAFRSDATNLVEGDTNGVADCFMHDRMTGDTIRVSVASNGTQANNDCIHYGLWGMSYGPSISANGRYVTYHSNATNLVEGGTSGNENIFVYDRVTGETISVSVSSDGTQGNGNSIFPSISADGRYVAFCSDASNLVKRETNGGIFVHDRVTGETTVVSVSSDGTQENGGDFPNISSDGRYVTFLSNATNLVDGVAAGYLNVFVHDRVTGKTTFESVSSDGTQGNEASYFPAISADGRYVVFSSLSDNLVEGDTNGDYGVFVHDRVTGETNLVSVSSDGTQGYNDLSISADGRYMAFSSLSDNLVEGDANGVRDVFVRDLGTGK
jgi:Tol biopolymer transport system component